MKSCPELLFSRIFHLPLAFGTGSLVPDTDVVAATLQAQSPHLASVGRGYVSNDPTHDDVLDGLAIRTRHSRDLLTEQTTPLIRLGFITAGFTVIFPFPSHMNFE